ncbi:MAG: RNA polymerase subunit sigma-24 [Chlorobiaceae bacterium]|nr:RNA polymerase subunit sigma-24 [Chlorobiaceae bacterium]
MEKKNRKPFQLVDDIYSIGCWITGSKEDAAELIEKTYLIIDPEATEIDVFKTFRHCLLDSLKGISCIPKPSCNDMEKLGYKLIKQDAEVKLTVLLAEISGLSPVEISKIMGKSVEEVKFCLTTGRKRFATDLIILDGRSKSPGKG